MAWLDYVDHWRAGLTRGDYETTDARLAFDINEAASVAVRADLPGSALSSGDDTELLALGRDWEAVSAQYDAAIAVQKETERRCQYPEIPANACPKPRDAALGIAQLSNEYGDGAGRWYAWVTESDPKALGADPTVGMLRKIQRRNGQPCPKAQARANEICTAMDWYWAACTAAEVTAGMVKAEAKTRRLGPIFGEIEDRIVATPALTVAGLRVKARLQERDESQGMEPRDGLMSALWRDIARMNGEDPMPIKA